jgi:glycosyl transferase family 25
MIIAHREHCVADAETPMRVHVINLEGSTARRAAIQGRLDALGVDYVVNSAVEGRAGAAYFDDRDLWRYWLNTGRSPSDGEVGCYASHLRLWRLCVDTDEPLVVLEDDAAPLPTFAAALAVTRRIVARYGFVRLEYDGPSRPARTRELESVGEFSVHYFVKYPYGAMCYALTPEVARAFLAGSRVLRAPVDQFIKRCWEHGQPLYGLLPYAVKEGPDATASTIRARDKKSPPARQRARRLVHKLQTGWQRYAFNQRWAQNQVGGARALD